MYKSGSWLDRANQCVGRNTNRKFFNSFKTYQFDGDAIVRDEIGGEVNSTVRTLTQHVRQLITFAQDPWYLSLHVDEFAVDVGFIARVGCAGRLLRGSGCTTMLPNRMAHGHLVRWVRTLPLRYQIVTLVNLHLLHILYTRINGIVFFLAICSASNILDLAASIALEITTLIIEMLEHLDD